MPRTKKSEPRSAMNVADIELRKTRKRDASDVVEEERVPAAEQDIVDEIGNVIGLTGRQYE